MMTPMMPRTLPLPLLVTVSTLLSGCFSDTDTICERRKECFSDTLNVQSCEDDLRDWMERQDQERRRDTLADCADCVGSKTCSQIRTACIGACMGVP
ncbi:putative lipoprotein [Corallococcus macrosporus]|uniref:Putative lipoprotein n=2 Tax=Myxococcaceae TaxID=31 RepID=F8CBJ8_MYXFH|nr:putative lipoprotein [Corallococcus macrosporus]